MKLKNIIAIFSIAAITLSCNDLLEVDPQQSLPLDGAYGSFSDLNTALIGAYNRFQDPNLWGGDFVLAADLLSNNINWTGSFTGPQEIQGLNIQTDNGNVTGMYTDTYRLINDANAIILSIPNVSDADAAALDQIRGQALFMRGAVYFESVRFFARQYGASSTNDLGLPISAVFADGLDKVEELPRATVGEVYAQAIADLQEAEGLLPIDNGDGLINRDAATSYLAEIAFQQGNYADAATFSNTVISSGRYSLVPNVASIFASEFSSESIMEVEMTTQDNPGVNAGLSTFYNSQARSGRGDINIANDLFSAFDDALTADQQAAITADGVTVTDTRISTLVVEGNVAIKYEDGVTNTDNPIVFRLAELLLMRAESLARVNGLNQESVDLLNQIRERAFEVVDGVGDPVADESQYVSFTLADFASADELIERIIDERRLELAFEGNRYHDLRRLGRDVRGAGFNADNVVWPMPQNAVDRNSNLVQNPGY